MPSKEHNKPVVPTFASFKKQKPPGEPPASAGHSSKAARDGRDEESRNARSKDRDRDRDRDQDRDRERDRDGSHRKRPKHSPHRHRHSHRRSPSPQGEADALRNKPVAAADKAGRPEDALFTIDQRGDPLILRYGSNDRSRVPAYRRGGRGRVLGGGRGFIAVDRDGANEVFAIRTASREGQSVFSQKSSSLLRIIAAKGKRTTPRPAGTKGATPATHAAPEDFVPLGGSRKRKRDNGDEASPYSSDDDTHRFRPVDIRQPSKALSDSDYMSDEDGTDPEAGVEDDDVNKEFIDLSRHVKDHPDDVDCWLRLIKLQDSKLWVDGDGVDDPDSATGNARRSLADVKLSMFESALPHAKSDADRERLLLGLMREGSRVWSPKTLAARWARVAEEHPSSFRLWRAHLNHAMTNVASFSFEETKALLVRRMEILKASLVERATAPVPELADLSDQLVYVLLRATRFLQDAGFGEMAMAAWQAVLELTFARPPELADADTEVCITAFRSFWESEVPRFGEEGSRGWRQASADDEAPEPKAAGPGAPPASRDAYKAWAALERHKAMRNVNPARTMDAGADDDPFRVVLIADIEDLLFAVPSSILSHTKTRLVSALLQLYRLPPPFGSGSLPYSAHDDPFVAGDHAQLDEDIRRQGADELNEQQQTEGQDGRERLPQFRQDQAVMAPSADILFSEPEWFAYFPLAPGAPELQAKEGALTWVLNVVEQLVVQCGFEELAEYHLALQWLRDPQAVRKTSKALLKNLYPTNTALYRAYAAAECANGNAELAHKILVPAASQKLSADVAETQALWNAAAWAGLLGSGQARASACLFMSVDEESRLASSSAGGDFTVTPAMLLKMRQTFQTARDYQLSSGNIEAAAQFAESFALLEYLANNECGEPKSDKQGNISAAIAGIVSLSADLCSRGHLARSLSHERLLQFAAKLLYFHARQGPFRPAFLREKLLNFVNLFPQNTMFLALFAWAESSLRIDDPVRKLLQKTVLVEAYDSVPTRIFSIRHELRAGNAYTTRAAFERALGSDACAGDPRLWLSYVRFVCGRAELRRKGRAKDVFYRAVAACPWSKEVLMEGFADWLARDLSSGELRAVFETMSGRGLRIHVDQEEFLEGWRRSRKGERS